MPLTVTRRHGSPSWYLRGSVRGIRIDESTRTGEREAAEQIRITREAELLTRSIHGDAVSRTFAEAALSYLQGGGEKKHVGLLLEHFGDRPLAHIGQAEIDGAARKVKPRGSPSTRNRTVYTPAVAILNHAARMRWCGRPVIARPKQPKGRVRWITYEEAERLIQDAAPHLRPLVVFLLCTGARLSEALYLDWRQVDLSRAHVTFLDTKNGEDRGVPLHPRAVAAVASVAWPREGAVFRRPAGKIGRTGRLWLPYEDREGKGGGQVSTAWAGMCRRAKVRDFSPHDCRHTWATWHYTANRDLLGLMKLGGWKSLAMVERYAHVNVSHLAPSVHRLWVENAA